MLFNMDRQTKQNIFNQYKQDALDYEKRKADEKKRKIQEEREFLSQQQKRETEIEDRLRYEKMKKQTETMEEYKQMLQKIDRRPQYRTKMEDVKINNYGYDPNQPNNISQLPREQPKQQEQKPLGGLNGGEMNDNYRLMSPNEKERSLIRREDHMSNFLTDKPNHSELLSYFQNKKQNQQRFYKEMLDQQCQQRVKNQINPLLEKTQNMNIINYHKRFKLPTDPFKEKRNFDFGLSNLLHNPITNPENNLQYNKYLNINSIVTPSANNIQDQRQNQYFNAPTGNYGQQPMNVDYRQQDYQKNYQDNYRPKYQDNYQTNQQNNNYRDNYQQNYMDNQQNNNQDNYHLNSMRNNNQNYQDNFSQNYNQNYQEQIINNNCGNNLGNYNNQSNYMNNNFNQPNNQYQREQHVPTPSGQTLRQAAATNIFS